MLLRWLSLLLPFPCLPHRAPVTVDVVVPVPLDRTFTYLVPEALTPDIARGVRVLVPFRQRKLTGVVVAVDADADGSALDFTAKPIADVLEVTPALTNAMLRLTRWMADYYVCGWGEVVRAALPSGTDVATERRLRRTETPVPETWENHTRARAVLEDLAGRDATTLTGLRQRVGPVPLRLIRKLAGDGLLTLTTGLSEASVQVKTETHLRLAAPFQTAGAVRDAREQLRGPKQRLVLEVMAGLLAEGVDTPRQADVVERAEASYSTIHRLIEMGLLESVTQQVNRSPLDNLAPPSPPPDHAFHPHQAAALKAIEEAIAEERFESFLLHGVTGSGKTEVYIAALKAVRARGKTGIILVPEIALTPQTVQRFRAHFGDHIAVLHSRMSLGERFDAWRHLRDGRYDIAIGPRSAILAPLENLGLIVVDEEHEPSYKQFDPAPRYHARDVAVMRAHMNDAVVVLGTATPSAETYTNAEHGKYTLLPMPERVPNAAGVAVTMPSVDVVDLTLERKKHRLEGAISETLYEAIATRLDRNEQVILLQNRRGYAPVIECENCGWAPGCSDCAVTMTYHKARGHLRCHYCGRAERLPRTCPECGSDELTQIGTGTQRVEEELHERLPHASILRMDLDTTSRKNAHHDILDRFRRGAADVLLGTQMVAKGLDFPRVTLVGVVSADVGLLLPDFRAEERTFQLLTQVAGRAGRAELPGTVLLQTRNPEHPLFHAVTTHDYHDFMAYILNERQMLRYPPFARLAVVEFRGPDAARVEKVARQWTGPLRQRAAQADGPVEVLGPEPPMVGRVKKQFRYHTHVRVPRVARAPALQPLLRAADEAFGSPPRGYHVAIDVDALGLF